VLFGNSKAMLGYSYMVRSLTSVKDKTLDYGDHTNPNKEENVKENPQQVPDFWVVCGKLKRRTKKQVLRDKLRRLEVSDLHRVATLGVGGFGR
jgi:hypothetical protein